MAEPARRRPVAGSAASGSAGPESGGSAGSAGSVAAEAGSAGPARTVHDLAREQLAALGGALAVAPARQRRIASVFDELADVGGDQQLDRPPRWSGMTDDCSPVEWSVAFRAGEPDIRVLVEAQREPASVATYWEASRDLTRWAVDHVGADDEVLREIIDGFEPVVTDAYAAAYHGFEFQHEGSVRTKVYLNPAAAGDRWSVATGALDRVGLGAQVEALLARVGPLDLPLLAVDLEPAGRARAKLYLRSGSLAALEAVGDLCEPPCSADYRPLVRALSGAEELGRPPFVALHLVPSPSSPAAAPARPARAVLSIPVLDPDLEPRPGPADGGAGVGGGLGADGGGGVAAESAAGRIAALLRRHGLDADAYLRVVDALAPLGPAGALGPVGLHSWVSFQREPDGSPRVTVYFRLRAFVASHGWLGADPLRTWPSPVDASATPP